MIATDIMYYYYIYFLLHTYSLLYDVLDYCMNARLLYDVPNVIIIYSMSSTRLPSRSVYSKKYIIHHCIHFVYVYVDSCCIIVITSDILEHIITP